MNCTIVIFSIVAEFHSCKKWYIDLPTVKNLFLENIAMSIPTAHKINIVLPKNIDYLNIVDNYLKYRKFIGVGYASVEQTIGTHTYILQPTDEKSQIQGTAPVDAYMDDITSNRT